MDYGLNVVYDLICFSADLARQADGESYSAASEPEVLTLDILRRKAKERA